MRLTDHGGFRHARIGDQSGLDFHRAEPVPRDLQHIVNAAHDPVAAIGIAVGAVAGDVIAVVKFPPVGFQITCVIAPDGAQHRWPGRGDDQIATSVGTGDQVTMIIDDLHVDTGQGLRAGAGFGGGHARERRDHDGASLGLPPGVDNRTALAANDTVIPHPRFRIDRFTY